MVSERSWMTTLILCVFFGVFGLHRFYVGKWKSGILMFLTYGLFGIGALVDFIMIMFGKFKDENGALITPAN